MRCSSGALWPVASYRSSAPPDLTRRRCLPFPGGSSYIRSFLPLAGCKVRATGTGVAHEAGCSYRAGMSDFMEKAKDMASQHDDKVDQGMERAGDMADERTGDKYGEQIDKGVDMGQERTGSGDTVPDQP